MDLRRKIILRSDREKRKAKRLHFVRENKSLIEQWKAGDSSTGRQLAWMARGYMGYSVKYNDCDILCSLNRLLNKLNSTTK